jgi:hypothetical protein
MADDKPLKFLGVSLPRLLTPEQALEWGHLMSHGFAPADKGGDMLLEGLKLP